MSMIKIRKLKNMLLSENMIIVSAKGTPGKVVITPKHWEGWFISSNLMKIGAWF
jgi:type I restriction enzyme, S subunit